MSGWPNRKYHSSRLTIAELQGQLRDLDNTIRNGARLELDRRAAAVGTFAANLQRGRRRDRGTQE